MTLLRLLQPRQGGSVFDSPLLASSGRRRLAPLRVQDRVLGFTPSLGSAVCRTAADAAELIAAAPLASPGGGCGCCAALPAECMQSAARCPAAAAAADASATTDGFMGGGGAAFSCLGSTLW